MCAVVSGNVCLDEAVMQPVSDWFCGWSRCFECRSVLYTIGWVIGRHLACEDLHHSAAFTHFCVEILSRHSVLTAAARCFCLRS